MTTSHSRAVRRTLQGLVVALGAFACPRHAIGQAFPTGSPSVSDRAVASDGYSPITPEQRLDWSANGLFGRPAVLAAIAGDVWQTAWHTPPEWGTWHGAGYRLAEREADVALSNGIEAGLGSLWSEDPRYIRLGRGAVIRRLGYAARTVFVAPRKDGAMAPAWARYAGNTVNNVIENAWLPPSQRTWRATAIRSGNSIFGRLATNMWGEFGRDLMDRWSHRNSHPTAGARREVGALSRRDDGAAVRPDLTPR
jgi:hypothetical protein